MHSIKLLWNLSLLLSNSSLGNGNLKLEQHSRIISLFTVLNNFIRNRTTIKSNDLKELFGKVKHSSPYNKRGTLHMGRERVRCDLHTEQCTYMYAVQLARAYTDALPYRLIPIPRLPGSLTWI